MERSQEEKTEQSVQSLIRSSYVWKNAQQSIQAGGGWILSGLFLLASICKFSMMNGIMLWVIWGMSGCFSAALYTHRKSNEGNARLLSGVMGIVAVYLSLFYQNRIRLMTSVILLGCSHGLTAASGKMTAQRKAMIYLGLEEDSAVKMIRHLPMQSYVGGGALMMICVWMMSRARTMLPCTLPALVMGLMLVRAAWNDPMDQRALSKVERAMELRSLGIKNSKIDVWLQNGLVQKRHRPWVIYAIICVLKVFFHHQTMGTENLRQDPENPIVFLANHGAFYGPVAAKVFTPAFVRPWVISYIMTDPEETIAYLYKYTFGPQKWIPKQLRMPITKLATRLSHRAMRMLESIPVYRDHPAKLRNTFRLAIEAMQGEDDMLIFPENPNAVEQDHGYEKSGVGELFAGFAMLAPLYYSRTGKCCRFVPMFSHQKSRKIAYGHEIVYDPENDPIEERARLVNETRKEMNRLAAELEEAYQQKKHHA